MSFLTRLAASVVLGLSLQAATFAEPLTPKRRAELLDPLPAAIARLDAAIALNPERVALYSRRGDAHLFHGDFARSVADFEKMIVLDPAQDAPHWRLGIAYYFAGQFANSARQFEKHHRHNPRDRENGIWKFLAQAKVDGIEQARRDMLVYSTFDREPFPALYEMFAGKKTPAEVIAHAGTVSGRTDDSVMFFANYYAGLAEALRGNRETALTLLAAAVASSWGQSADGSPAYMWQIARLHHEQLGAAAAKP